jgi:hypothetical protein
MIPHRERNLDPQSSAAIFAKRPCPDRAPG